MVRLSPRLRPLFPYLKPAYVRATGVLAPTMQAVSRRKGGLLPTGVVATLDQAARSTGGRCVTAREAEVLIRPPMQGEPAGMPLLDAADGESIARVAVAELPGGRVLGPHRAVVSGRGDLVQEVSWYFGTRRARQHPLFLNPFPALPTQVPGRLAVLTSRGDRNYFHFMMDVLTRLGVLEQAPDIEPPDRWYVAQSGLWQRDLIDMMGVPTDKRVDADAHPHVQAETLVVPGAPDLSDRLPPWVVPFLRSRLLPHVQAKPLTRRIFLSRDQSANNRSVRNQDEVIAMLAERGFEAIDTGKMSIHDQIETFASASVVVAPHGAALTNLVFVPPGSSAIEIFPAGALLPEFWRLATAVGGVNYRYLSSYGGPRRHTRAKSLVQDIDVDVAALREMVDKLPS